MHQEIAVLAALHQLDKPTKSSIAEITGMSSLRVTVAIRNLKDILNVQISWQGTRKTGYYSIESWGAFESGNKIRRRVLALDLNTYKLNKTINYDIELIKNIYYDETKLENYRHSMRLEGFDITTHSPDISMLTKRERKLLQSQLIEEYVQKQ